MAETSVWPWRLLAGCLIVAAALGRIAYLIIDCPLDLSPDEAHYWDWSRHLDWSYYSKGPLVAWLIRISWYVFAWTGNEMLAVRLPAVVCGSLLLASMYVLTVQVFGREKWALAVVALALTMPVINAGALLMTIDAPFTCCWGWALVFGYQAVFRGSWWAWPLTGMLAGVGLLAKYTMVLWPGSLVLFLAATPAYRRLCWCSGFMVLAGLAGLFTLPIVLWNAGHDWVTFRHLLGHAGFQEPSAIHWLGPIRFLGGQFFLLLGFWFVTWAAAMVGQGPWKKPSPIGYLWWMSAPTFLIFWLFSFKNGGGEVNWPVPAYLSGMVLAAGWLASYFQAASPVARRTILALVIPAIFLGIGMTVVMHDTRMVRPVLARISGPATSQRPFPLRRLDPTCRLKGWRTLAREVDKIRAHLAEEGIDPVLAVGNWSLAGQLGFNCRGHPEVYSLGLVMGDRHSQYDFWRPNPVADPRFFSGKTFILVGVNPDCLKEFFAFVGPARLVTYTEDGQPIAGWTIFVAREYRGCDRTVFGKLPLY